MTSSKRYNATGPEVRGNRINRRRQFRNDGRPSSSKWIDQEAGIKVTFRPRLTNRGRRAMLPTIVYARVPDRGPDGVECRVCGISLLALSSHINRVHGMNAAEYRAKYGADAPMMQKDVLDSWVTQAKATAKRRHERNKKKCPQCGNLFQKGKGSARPHTQTKYCSDRCEAAALRALRSSPESVSRLMQHATLAPQRITYINEMRRNKKERQTIACIICGARFTTRRRLTEGVVGVCSYNCRAEHKRQLDSQQPKLPRVSRQQRALLSELAHHHSSTHGSTLRARVMNSLHKLGLARFFDTTPNPALRGRTPASSHNFCEITDLGRAVLDHLKRKRDGKRTRVAVVHAPTDDGRPRCGSPNARDVGAASNATCRKCLVLLRGEQPRGIAEARKRTSPLQALVRAGRREYS